MSVVVLLVTWLILWLMSQAIAEKFNKDRGRGFLVLSSIALLVFATPAMFPSGGATGHALALGFQTFIIAARCCVLLVVATVVLLAIMELSPAKVDDAAAPPSPPSPTTTSRLNPQREQVSREPKTPRLM